jgi:hypothetical protein
MIQPVFIGEIPGNQQKSAFFCKKEKEQKDGL